MSFLVQYYIEYSIFISSPGCPEASMKHSGVTAATTVLFKVLYCKIKNIVFFFIYIICVSSITNLVQYSTR